jgi:hypothetical protein
VHESKTENKKSFFQPILKLVLLFVAIVFVCVLLFKHPSDYGFIPSCVFYKMTGLYCPGCGSMRAMHFLLTGSIFLSLRCNPLVIFLFPLIIFLLIKWLYAIFGQKELTFRGLQYIYWGVLVVIVLFFIIRNIPVRAFDFLRPLKHGDVSVQIFEVKPQTRIVQIHTIN